jgi:hypothetical protein
MQDSTGESEFDLSRRDILFHEYVHHLMAQHSDAAYPLWYSEGFAEYYAMTDLDADGAARTGAAAPHRLAALEDGHWLPIGQLLAARGPADLDGQELMFYSQSWLLVHYLASEPARHGQLERYLLAINRGSTSEAAAIEAFGPLGALEDALRDYAARPEVASQTAHAPAAAAPIAVRTLDAAAADVLPYEAALGRGIAPWMVKRFAREVRAIAARHPDDARALALRATAELMVSNRKAAGKAVDRWLALRPDEPRALMYKAMVGFAGLAARKSTKPSQWSEARQWLERARALAPRDPMLMDIYYDSFATQGITPPAEASDALIRAMQLVPQFDELRLKVASDYERRNHIEAAIMVVKPAVFRSEGPGASIDQPERAAAMLARLQRKLAAAPPRMSATFRPSGPRPAN